MESNIGYIHTTTYSLRSCFAKSFLHENLYKHYDSLVRDVFVTNFTFGAKLNLEGPCYPDDKNTYMLLSSSDAFMCRFHIIQEINENLKACIYFCSKSCFRAHSSTALDFNFNTKWPEHKRSG